MEISPECLDTVPLLQVLIFCLNPSFTVSHCVSSGDELLLEWNPFKGNIWFSPSGIQQKGLLENTFSCQFQILLSLGKWSYCNITFREKQKNPDASLPDLISEEMSEKDENYKERQFK